MESWNLLQPTDEKPILATWKNLLLNNINMVLKADCDDVREVLKEIYEQVYLCINPNFHYADVSLVYQFLTESYGILIIELGRKPHYFIVSIR